MNLYLINFNQIKNHYHHKHMDNYTYFNICDQYLYCKHYLWAARNISANGVFNYDDLIKIYGNRTNGGNYCKICGVLIQNVDTLDVEEFEGGEDGGIASGEMYAIAKQSLADAIALESGRYLEESVWFGA